MSACKIVVDKSPGLSVVRLTGSMVISEAPAVFRAIHQAAQGAMVIALDVRALSRWLTPGEVQFMAITGPAPPPIDKAVFCMIVKEADYERGLKVRDAVQRTGDFLELFTSLEAAESWAVAIRA